MLHLVYTRRHLGLSHGESVVLKAEIYNPNDELQYSKLKRFARYLCIDTLAESDYQDVLHDALISLLKPPRRKHTISYVKSRIRLHLINHLLRRTF